MGAGELLLILGTLGGAIAWLVREIRLSPAERWRKEKAERDVLRADFETLRHAHTSEIKRLNTQLAQVTVEHERTHSGDLKWQAHAEQVLNDTMARLSDCEQARRYLMQHIDELTRQHDMDRQMWSQRITALEAELAAILIRLSQERPAVRRSREQPAPAEKSWRDRH